MARRTVAGAVMRGLRQEIREGTWVTGEVLPSFATLGETFGASPKSVMKAVATLEREGVLSRQSPRRIVVAVPSPRCDVRPVGLMSFEGHLWEGLGHSLVRRLYDRKVDAVMLNPVRDTEPALRRWCAHFFDRDYRALAIRDGSNFPVHVLEEYAHRIGRLILVGGAYNRWHLPHFGVYTDRAFSMADGLRRLRLAGCRQIWRLGGRGAAPGCTHPRDRAETGEERFLASHPDISVEWRNPYEMDADPSRQRAWAAEVRPGDGIFGSSDYWVIKAQEWLGDVERLATCTFLGEGNTPWSEHGAHRFASYDFRLDDQAEQVLAWIDGPDCAPTIRRLRPRLARPELLEGR